MNWTNVPGTRKKGQHVRRGAKENGPQNAGAEFPSVAAAFWHGFVLQSRRTRPVCDFPAISPAHRQEDLAAQGRLQRRLILLPAINRLGARLVARML
jgi:hypothetical protein